MLQAWADRDFERELERLPPPIRKDILDVVQRLVRGEPADVRPVRGTVTGSVRVRSGQHRVLALLLPKDQILLLTTLFRKRRPADYRRALARHERRVAAYLAERGR